MCHLNQIHKPILLNLNDMCIFVINGTKIDIKKVGILNYIIIMEKLFLLLFGLAMIFSSCKRDNNLDPIPSSENMENLDITSSFDWKTTNDYQLTVTGKESNLFEVLSSDKGVAYQRAFLTANEPYFTKIIVPSYEKLIVLKYLDQEVTLELNSDNLSYQFQ